MKNWETDIRRRPTIKEGETLLFSEHGRIVKGGEHYSVDYRSHWFCLTKNEYHYYLLVSHGGGEERIQIEYSANIGYLLQTLEQADSDTKYFLFYHMYRVHKNAAKNAMEETAARYRSAFVNNKLKKRKQRGGSGYKVWIEN